MTHLVKTLGIGLVELADIDRDRAVAALYHLQLGILARDLSYCEDGKRRCDLLSVGLLSYAMLLSETHKKTVSAVIGGEQIELRRTVDVAAEREKLRLLSRP